jgi:ferredoxin-NADP reductase
MFGERTQNITFLPEQIFAYQPGQYIEMTLPHAHADARGLRRYFTLASSPTESQFHLGVRYYTPSSTFKLALRNPAGHEMAFGQVGGDFVMPKDKAKKLVFIAGGIGITPFRSMVKFLSDTGEVRDIIILYAERNANDIAYYNELEEARRKVSVQTTYLLETPAALANSQTSRITSEIIEEKVPDYRERIFYISGPQPMVHSVKRMLHELGVSSRHIKTDYFSGYA